MVLDFSGWTLVFDLDGTLVDTAPDLHAALNHTLASKQLGPVSLDSIRMMIGDGAKALIRKGLQHHDVAVDQQEIDTQLWPLFPAHYRTKLTQLSRPFEGVLTTLGELKTAGATLAVCTNKAQHLAEPILQALGMAHYFTTIVGGDALAVKKPDGEHILETIRQSDGKPSRAIMVGDSQTDEKAARNAGLPFVFVSFGYGSLSNQPYDRLRCVNHWRDMMQALNELAQMP